MLVNIDKKERDIVAKMCAQSNCKVDFYTLETNPLMLRAEILELNGGEISARDAWYIGRSVVWVLATEDIKTP